MIKTLDLSACQRLTRGDLDALLRVALELDAARAAHPDFPTLHHGFAVVQEEVFELWLEVIAKRPVRANLEKEARQVAATALRFLSDLVAKLTPGDAFMAAMGDADAEVERRITGGPQNA